MRTPVTAAGLLKYDHLPAIEAVLAAWREPGPRPDWHRATQQEVRDCMPLLARAIERLVVEDRHRTENET